jgi:GNAT superfamily N-acetyltransferase
LLAEAFTRRDPLATAVGVTIADFESLVRLLLPHIEEQDLTVVARDASTGAPVGVMLAEDSATPTPAGMDTLSPCFDPIFGILQELELDHCQPGERLHLFLLATAEPMTGRGIAQQLVSRTIENGARRGYRGAICEATNPTSQHVFRKLGFQDRTRRTYADYEAFRSVAWAGGPILMEKIL